MKRVQLTVAVLAVLACSGAVAGGRERASGRLEATREATGATGSQSGYATAPAGFPWIPGPWSPSPPRPAGILDELRGTLSYFRASGDGRDSALASGTRSVAAGSSSRAEGQLSSAYGAGSRAAAYGGLAAGANAQAPGGHAYAKRTR